MRSWPEPDGLQLVETLYSNRLGHLA